MCCWHGLAPAVRCMREAPLEGKKLHRFAGEETTWGEISQPARACRAMQLSPSASWDFHLEYLLSRQNGTKKWYDPSTETMQHWMLASRF